MEKKLKKNIIQKKMIKLPFSVAWSAKIVHSASTTLKRHVNECKKGNKVHKILAALSPALMQWRNLLTFPLRNLKCVLAQSLTWLTYQ